jgi:ATP-dependent helicase/nuclease subunit B
MPLLLYNTARPEFTSLDFKEAVLAAARGGELTRHIFILPTRRLVGEIERELTREHFRITGRPIERLPVHTIGSFAREFHGLLQPSKRDVTPEVQLALMQTAMKRIDLEYYARGGRAPSLGVVEKITRVINGVRADGIMPSDFANDIEYSNDHPEETRFDRAKLTDLYNIYSEYLRLLSDYWIDYAGRMTYLNTALFQDRESTFRRAFPEVRHLLVHGFSEFTQPELALLQQLGMVESLDVQIYFDYAAENGPLYGNFDDVHRKLTLSGYRTLDLDPLETDIPEKQRQPFRHHMRKNLFRTDERIENSSFDERINVYGFFNREEEAQGIAALVKSLVIDEGIQPERICITAFNMEPYAPLFHEHLASNGIPANITTPFLLDRNTLLTALLSALAIPANGYDRRDVIRAITSPYLSFGGTVDAAALTEAATRLRIRRGRATWGRRIGQRIDFLIPRLATVADDDDRRAIELELETLRRAAESIGALEEVLDEFDRRMTPAEFGASFRKLVAKLRAAENIMRLRHDLDARSRTPQDWQRIHDEMERDTRALAAFYRLLDEMTEFFEVEYGTSEKEEDGEGRYPLDFYIDQLRTAALRAQYGLREKHDYGVLVTPTWGMRGISFDAVIVCGLVDGEFPSTYIPETFLGRPLPGAQERQLRRERMEFYGAITQFGERLVMTYPRYAGETALVRSSFLDAFLRITTVEETGRAVELEELRVLRDRARRDEPLPPHTGFLGYITTYEALAEEAGAVLWRGGEIPWIEPAETMLENLRFTSAVERERSRAKSESDDALARPFRGIITEALAPEESEVLAARREIAYSASQLELYARCPFKFFARRIIGATAPATYDVSLTPLERGLLLHKVLFQLYTELRENGELPITTETREDALARARELARNEIDGIVFDHPYWRIDQERLLGSNALDGLLEQWIATDVERLEEEKSELVPEFFEVSFGAGRLRSGSVDGRLSSGEEVRVNDLQIQGTVDRVEIYRRGEDIYFAVADYKTGTPPGRKDIREGTSLQLMIYLEVMRHKLAEHYEVALDRVKPVGGLYYRLDARNVDTKTTAIFVPNELKKDVINLRASKYDPDTVEELEQIIDDVFVRANEYVEGIATGRFHVTTRDVNEVCRGCEYQAVCRVRLVGLERSS